ncbi:MAG: hypothetical protein QOI10_2570 [Solirubrobacterales bacterium]|nr:hypothetical protein [Solirubrobacterales bacterium]
MSDGHQFVFVGGLHRSGTTPLTRWLGQHPDVSIFRDTGAPEDEGQHLQGVFLPAGGHGGAGRFAFDPDARLTETSALLTERTRGELWEGWSPHWDLEKPVLVEKSPPNLIRTRFLQAVFGASDTYFIVIMRHPTVVAYATKRWRGHRHYSVRSLVEHWLAAHELLLEDASRLTNLRLIRYEELVADPNAVLASTFAFMELAPQSGEWPAQSGLNRRYLKRWHRIPLGPFTRPVFPAGLDEALEARVRRFGYSLSRPEELSAPQPSVEDLFATPG